MTYPQGSHETDKQLTPTKMLCSWKKVNELL